MAWALERTLVATRIDDCDEGDIFVLKESEHRFDLLFRERVLLGGQPLAVILEFLLAKINALVSYQSADFVFLRGDVMLTPGGAAIMLVGPSMSGKSYLAKTLQRKGADSWSSFYAVLDRDGLALEYPRATVPEGRARVSLAAKVVYDPRGFWSVKSASAGQMALKLMPYLEGSESSVADSLEPLARLCSNCDERIIGTRGDADDCIDMVLDLVATSKRS